MHATCYNRRCTHHGHHTDVSKKHPAQSWNCDRFSTALYEQAVPMVLEDGFTCRQACIAFDECPGCEECKA